LPEPPSSLAIRDLKPEEVADAIQLWEGCGLTRPWNDPELDARRALEGPSSTILAGFLEGSLAATAMVGADGHRAWVYYLAVSPAFRGAGFGRTMMRAAEAWARRGGMPKLELMVREGNAGAAAFYAALGYRQEPVSVHSIRLET
jgi:ribosomal protein S18 acetylase RimI-like enzyme